MTSTFDGWDGVHPPTPAGFDPAALDRLPMLAELRRGRLPVVLDTSCVRTGLHSQLANGRVPLEWRMDRYQVRTDKNNGIVNDPNGYSNSSTYVLDLIGKIVRVSIDTVAIVNQFEGVTIETSGAIR